MCNPATGSYKSQRCLYTYGQNKILAPIFNNVQKVANGYEFDINGTPTEMFGAVVSCLGDTEGQHQWGGFKVQVGWAPPEMQILPVYIQQHAGKLPG